MLSIGEFSKVTSLTIKAIRLYHEKGLLKPARVDPQSGYRYYDPASVERARAILALRALDFSIEACREILEACGDDADILSILERQRGSIEKKIERYRDIRQRLDGIISNEKEARMAAKTSGFDVVEKVLDPLRVAGLRTKGRYAETGTRLRQVARKAGRHIAGKPLNLYYDGEYKEENADFESCFPVRKLNRIEGLAVHELPGGRCVSFIHKGPYEELGRSYEKVFQYIREKGLKAVFPSREVYVKGPGMIFKGNPKKYLTEIQIPIESGGS